MLSAVPADFVRGDSDADEGSGSPAAAAAALVEERSDTDAGGQPAESAGPVKLAASVTSEETEAAPAPHDPEQDTAILPAAGQDRDVPPASTDGAGEEGAAAADDSCIRWAAQLDAAEPTAVQRNFTFQQVLVWDPDAGEWVRLLLVWDRTPSDGDPGNENRDAAPEPAVVLPEPEADPEIDLTEPGVIAQEMPLWEQVFDRWEKALADRQREREHPCPGMTPAAL
jgi:hypothetical protein